VTSKVQQSENRHDKAGGERKRERLVLAKRFLEPFLVLPRLGLTSFGGPIAHLAIFGRICGAPQVAD